MSAWLADVILVAHFAVAAFITLGLGAIPVGAVCRWRWIRQRRLRLAHLAAIVFVAGEALIGMACPLTVLEDWLRGAAPRGGGFVEHWVGQILYWDLPAWVFTASYAMAAVLAWLLWRLVPPQRERS